MSKHFLKDAFLWGFILWLIGYILGIVLFPFVPPDYLGWVITPIGTLLTLWVLFKKVKASSLNYYLGIGIVWAIIAIICDYFLLVKVFKPTDGYYKLDVYLYYTFALLLPLIVGWKKLQSKTK